MTMNVNAVGSPPRDRAEFERRLGTMVARYRTECLWDLKASPDLEQEQVARMVLRRVISCADRNGYIEARGLLEWLLQTSNAESAGS